MTIVTMTEADIRVGNRGSCGYCPLALAIQRATNAREIAVDALGFIVFHNLNSGGWPTGYSEYNNTSKMAQFISDFDAGVEVEPLSPFDIDPLRIAD